MFLTKSTLILITLFALIFVHGARAEVQDLDKRVERLARPYVDGGWCASLCVGVLEGGRQHVFGFGETGHGKPDTDTVYEIGSATKAMTGWVAADLVRRGKINLEAPVAGLLPGLKLPAFGDRAITVVDLLTHSSGLPTFMPNLTPADWRNPYRDYTSHNLLEGLPTVKLERAPGSKYEYCNAGYALLGFMLAQHEGKPYADLLAERLFRPLKMTSTTVGGGKLERLASGHDADGQATPPWDSKVFEPAGAVRAPMRDVLTWVAANVAPGSDETGRSIAESHKPLRAADSGQIAYGWHVTPAGLIWHNGETGGHHVFVGFHKTKKIAVVVLASTACRFVDELATGIFSEVTGETPLLRVLPSAVPVPPADAKAYTGRFRIAPEQELVVRLENDRLTLQVPPQQPIGLFRLAGDEFFVRVVDARVTFSRGADGRIASLTLHQNGDHEAPRIE